MFITTDALTHEVNNAMENVTEFEGGIYETLDGGTKFIINESDIFDRYDGKIYEELTSVPDDFELFKYCYTAGKGLYLNPDWKEPNPYGIPDNLVEQIKNDAVEEIRQEVLRDVER